MMSVSDKKKESRDAKSGFPGKVYPGRKGADRITFMINSPALSYLPGQ
jgi:hypothetical protein